MVIRQLEKRAYDWLVDELRLKAHTEPLDASYTVNIRINDFEYDVKVQPEEDHQIAVLQAFCIDRKDYSPNFELLTDDRHLSMFLDILIDQGVRRH